MTLDPRVTAARGDLAAASLRGQVEADRFVEGERRVVIEPVAPLRRRRAPDAPLELRCGDVPLGKAVIGQRSGNIAVSVINDIAKGYSK